MEVQGCMPTGMLMLDQKSEQRRGFGRCIWLTATPCTGSPAAFFSTVGSGAA
jgi:hypothetical protein